MVYTCPLIWRGHVYTIENSVSVETAMRGLSTRTVQGAGAPEADHPCAAE
jgi:hypothetical protein